MKQRKARKHSATPAKKPSTPKIAKIAKIAKTAKTSKSAKTVKSAKTARGSQALRPEELKLVLYQFNDAAPDALDGGAASNWRFTDVSREGSVWKLHYTNSAHPGGDYVRFTHEGACVEGTRVLKPWDDAAWKALQEETIGSAETGWIDDY